MLDHALTLTLLVTLYVPSPPPALQPGPDTTVITEPLKADGTPDYAAWLNRKFGEGVTPENNFAVDLLGSMPADLLPEGSDLAAIWRELGIEPVGPKMMKLENEAPEALFHELSERPWRAEDHPDAAAWLAKNKGLLDALAEATKKQEFHLPLMMADGQHSITALRPHLSHSRWLVRVWRARVLLYLGSGRLETAWSDNLSMYRMGRHMRRGVLIDHLVGASVEALAYKSTTQILASKKIDAVQCRIMLNELKGLRAPEPIADSLAEYERFYSLQTIISTLTDPGQQGDATVRDLAAQYRSLGYGVIDPNLVLLRFNRLYDQLESRMRLDNPAERQRLEAAMDLRLKNFAIRTRQIGANPLFFAMITKSPPVVSRWVTTRLFSDALAGITFPTMGSVSRVEFIKRQNDEIVRVLIALAGYRAEHGVYPDQLDALVPHWLDAVPADVYTGGPVLYRIVDERPVVYSVGPDGEDDGGRVTQLSEDDTGLQIGGYEEPDGGGGFGR